MVIWIKTIMPIDKEVLGKINKDYSKETKEEFLERIQKEKYYKQKYEKKFDNWMKSERINEY